ncbi:hypothetical protein [[Phormidium] sp. ETS-05]|uniref:hypothetical protein n=1 Tax=[Phormidium] sp. ETS-05 TaxID=222819 RepID=UPI0018EED18D|nr:hypothetical protein [[Phormidium] sp. ETS-05]
MENRNLKAGLAALHEEDYHEAIAQLEFVCNTELHLPTIYRAQMGLVTAYAGIDDLQKALELCQSLTRSKSPQAREWANRQLPELAQLYADRLEAAQRAKRKSPQQWAIHLLVRLIQRYPQTLVYAYQIHHIFTQIYQKVARGYEFIHNRAETLIYKLFDLMHLDLGRIPDRDKTKLQNVGDLRRHSSVKSSQK